MVSVDAAADPTRADNARFEPGRTILRRYFRPQADGTRVITLLNVARVIADDDRGLVIWYPAGTPYWSTIDANGANLHQLALHEMVEPRLVERAWQGYHIVALMPPGAAHSVWWFFAADTGEFRGWYGNLEEPGARWDDGDICGIDTHDQDLDLEIAPDGRWRWKDVDEFEALVDTPLYWTAAEAAEIRAGGERLAKLAEAGAFPFDGTWCDFTPDPAWPVPQRPPTGWDRPA